MGTVDKSTALRIVDALDHVFGAKGRLRTPASMGIPALEDLLTDPKVKAGIKQAITAGCSRVTQTLPF